MSYSSPTPERRYVSAALRAFGQRGYFGTTMNHIADEAGVSQPRISQVFAGKEHAFITAVDLATTIANRTIREAFEAADATRAASGQEPGFDPWLVGGAMRDLIAERPEVVMIALHTASAARAVPAIAAAHRHGLASMSDELTACGASPEEAAAFIRSGFFLMALSSAQAVHHRHEHPGLDRLVSALYELGGVPVP